MLVSFDVPSNYLHMFGMKPSELSVHNFTTKNDCTGVHTSLFFHHLNLYKSYFDPYAFKLDQSTSFKLLHGCFGSSAVSQV